MPESPEKINIDITLSEPSTNVTQDIYPDNVSITQPSKSNLDVTLSQPSASVSQSYYPENVAVTVPGVQGEPGIGGIDGQDGAVGPQGPDGIFTPSGPSNAVQFKSVVNNTANFSGISEFVFDYQSKLLSIQDGGITIGNGKITLTGSNGLGGDETFLVKDVAGTNALRIDTQNKKISFAENASTTEYLMGVGVSSPQERLHIGNGNLRVDGDIKVGGDILPTASGVYDLGSMSFPFKDLFIQGDTIHFVNGSASMGIDSNTNEFTIVRNNKEILKIDNEGTLSGKIGYDSIMDPIIFKETQLNHGDRSKDVTWPELAKSPKVICNVVAPQAGSNADLDVYAVFPQDITKTGYTAVLSSEIYSVNPYFLHTYISPS